MVFKAEVVTFDVTSGTGSGSFDVDASASFGTPTAAIVMLSGSPNDSTTLENDLLISRGIMGSDGAGGTNQYVTAIYSQYNVAYSDTSRFMSDARIIQEIDNNQTTGGYCTAAFGTDKITLTYGAAFDKSYRGYIVFMTGTEDVLCTDIRLAQSDNSEDFDMGFEPDIVFFDTTTAGETQTTTASATGSASFGVATQKRSDGSVNHACIAPYLVDAVSWTNEEINTNNDRVGGAATAGGWHRSAGVTQWNAGPSPAAGFRLERIGGSAIHAIYFQVLAIKTPSDQAADCGVVTIPTSAPSTLSIAPDHYTDASEVCELWQTGDVNAWSGTSTGFSIGAADNALSQAVCQAGGEDNVDTSLSHSAHLDSALVLAYDAAQAVDIQAAISNLDSPDIDVSYTVVSSAADRACWWSIQKGAAGGFAGSSKILGGGILV